MNELMINETNIENMIYEIRGKQVMLDSDLAMLYGVETKRINEAVKNNIEKFPERFSWIITKDEWSVLRSKISTLEKHSGKGKYRKYLPRVFTEQGVAMLSTVLKSKIATRVSIRIMDAFVAMRHYIGNSEYRLSNVETKVLEHDKDIKLLQKAFEKFDEKEATNEIYPSGHTYDAYSRIIDIFNKAKKELIIIDSYTDKTLLDMIKDLKCKTVLITKENNKLKELDIEKYNSQYHNLKVIYNDTFHDRYFILDKETIYHSGTSINHAGLRTFSINVLEDKIVKEFLFKNVKDIIKY